MKVPKVKKRAISMHSRAARRAGSPSLDVDKSLLALDRPEQDHTPKTPKVLGVHDSGIKKKRGKQMTRQQRLRQQKGMERADAVQHKMEKKVEDSVVRSKKIKDRAAAWEELNEKATAEVTKPKQKVARVVEFETSAGSKEPVQDQQKTIEAVLEEVAGSKDDIPAVDAPTDKTPADEPAVATMDEVL